MKKKKKVLVQQYVQQSVHKPSRFFYVKMIFAILILALFTFSIIKMFYGTANSKIDSNEAQFKTNKSAIVGSEVYEEKPIKTNPLPDKVNATLNATKSSSDSLNKDQNDPKKVGASAAMLPNISKNVTFSNKYSFLDSQTNVVYAYDINKDGFDDVLIGNANTQGHLYLNNKLNGFLDSYNFQVANVNAISVADFDNDGFVDFAAGVKNDNNYIFYNDHSSKNFTRVALPKEYNINNPVTSMSAGDFDNDGKIDLAIGKDSDGNILYINSLRKKFVTSPQFGNWHTQDILFADFNNDGWQDVLTANYNQDSQIYFSRGTKFAKLFTPQPLTGEVGNFIRSATVCDLNNDGFKDIVSANYDQHSFIYYNTNGTYFEKVEFPNRGNSVAAVCADFNLDGWNDIIIVNYNEKSYLFLNNKTTFIKTQLTILQPIAELKAANIDGDKFPDLLVGRYGAGNTEIWINDLGKSLWGAKNE